MITVGMASVGNSLLLGVDRSTSLEDTINITGAIEPYIHTHTQNLLFLLRSDRSRYETPWRDQRCACE